jgi:hypothetical protein
MPVRQKERTPRTNVLKRHFRGYVVWQTQSFAVAAKEKVMTNAGPLPPKLID